MSDEIVEEKNVKHVNLRDINECYVYKITEGSFHIKKVSSFSCFGESLRVWNRNVISI